MTTTLTTTNCLDSLISTSNEPNFKVLEDTALHFAAFANCLVWSFMLGGNWSESGPWNFRPQPFILRRRWFGSRYHSLFTYIYIYLSLSLSLCLSVSLSLCLSVSLSLSLSLCIYIYMYIYVYLCIANSPSKKMETCQNQINPNMKRSQRIECKSPVRLPPCCARRTRWLRTAWLLRRNTTAGPSKLLLGALWSREWCWLALGR